MPQAGKLTFADLTFERLEVACGCGRHGWYSVNMLIIAHGPAYLLSEFLHDVCAECPKRKTGDPHLPCGAYFPHLPK